jgi:DNA-binding NtrC family response regulator
MQGQPEQHDLLPEPGSRSRRVLLAERDAALRGLVARTLRRTGFEVIESSSGSETLEWLGRSLIDEPPIDLVICDMRMPGYDGLNILASLRQSDARTPVILIAPFGSAAVHAAAARLGAFATVDKPFDVDHLMILARSAVRAAARPMVGGKDEELKARIASHSGAGGVSR